MGRAASHFRLADVERLLKAAYRSGYPTARVDVDLSTKVISVTAGQDVEPARPNSFD